MIEQYQIGIMRWKLNAYINDLLLVATTDPARFSRMVGGKGQSLGNEGQWPDNARINAEKLNDDSALQWLDMWPNVWHRIEVQ